MGNCNFKAEYENDNVARKYQPTNAWSSYNL